MKNSIISRPSRIGQFFTSPSFFRKGKPLGILTLTAILLLFGQTVFAQCTITVQFFGNPSACNDNGTPNDPSDDFFTQNINASFFNRPFTGSLQIVPGGDQIGVYSIPVQNIIGNSHTFTAVMLKADGTPTNVQMNFTDEPTCIDAAVGPTVNACSNSAPSCEIIGYSFNNIDPCNDNGTPGNSSDDYFTVDVDVLYSNSTNGDSLKLIGADVVLSPTVLASVGTNLTTTLNNVRFRADGNAVEFTGRIGTGPTEHCSQFGTGPAVNSCSTGGGTCAITDLELVNPGPCDDNGTPSDPTDDFYIADILVFFENPPTTGLLQVSGADLVDGTFSATIANVLSVGSPFPFSNKRFRADGQPTSFLAEFTGASGCVASLSTIVGVEPCSFPPPANDLCANAIPIPCNSTVDGTTVDATTDFGFPSCGFGDVASPNVWYSFVGNGGLTRLSLCGGTTDFDSRIRVFTGSCAAPVCFANNGGTSTICGGLSVDVIQFFTTAGTTYLVSVEGAGLNDVGNFTLELLCFNPFPPDETATVACPALAVAPTPPTYTPGTCIPNVPITPVLIGPVDTPSPLTCEGTREFIYDYEDCHGVSQFWHFTYTIERQPFTVPANGASTVACPNLAVAPTPPTVTSNCGETLTPTGPVITNNPNPLTCEGTRTFTWTFTDCEGNTAQWSHVTTIERQPFTVPANGSSTVACPNLAVAPTPPIVTSNCGEVLTPSAPVITNNPNPLTCEGTRTFTFTYTDCEGNTAQWSHVTTVERQPFTVPANGASQVACPALIVQPVPPVVTSNCGEVLTPTGPVIVNNPNPITCEGTRTFTFTYTDCEGNTAQWSHVTTVERQPFTIATPNGNATVDCPDDTDVQPTPPVVTSNCGEVLTPVLHHVHPKPGCEGDRDYVFRFTDCEGNFADWLFTYHVVYQDFTVPASEVETVNCPLQAVEPTPPTVLDNCGKPTNVSGPVITSTPNAQGCEGSRQYAWTFEDCTGNTHTWSRTYIFQYPADFFVPYDETAEVACLIYAQPPFPEVLYDICGQALTVTGPVVTEDIDASGCSGTRKFTFVYSDCGGHSHPWSFTYIANDNEPPVGNCAGGSLNGSVDVTNLACIADVPCPDDYDFSEKIAELLEAGNFYDLCSGDDLVVELDSWSALWQCADPDGDGQFTFGRTFYFRIADPCGNEFPSLCAVTYSGDCLPIETFTQGDWGIPGDEPGASVSATTTDLQVITTLLGQGPLTVGGTNPTGAGRSLTLTDAQCVVNLLPGIGNPTVLANCHQVNCVGCNPAGPAGMKNKLAANTIALLLNLRYNIHFNGLTMSAIRNQDLGCIEVDQNIRVCDGPTPCTFNSLRVFESNGTAHDFPYTIGGLLDLANLYLNGNLALTGVTSPLYAAALNVSIQNVNAYWHGGTIPTSCDQAAGSPFVGSDASKALPTGKPKPAGLPAFSLAPNPASGEVTFKLSEMAESQEVTFEIYNSLGQRMLRREFGKVASVSEQIDLNSLGASGLYIVSVKAGQQRFGQKLVIGKD